MTKLFFASLFIGWTLLSVTSSLAQAWLDSIKQTLSDIKSGRTFDQENNPIQAEISKAQDSDQKAAISWLISTLVSYNYDQQQIIAEALSKMKKPWKSTSDTDKQTLYNLLLQTKDPTLNKALDTALANADGLYFDAIDDYNDPGRTNNYASVDDKFGRVLRDFPLSAYAGNSAFYRAQYWSKLGQIKNSAEFVNNAQAAFDAYNKKADSDKPFTNARFDNDAKYFAALNTLLGGDEEGALIQLDKLAKRATANEPIYVYRFFYIGDYKQCDRIDRNYETRFLARKTAEFIRNGQNVLLSTDGPCQLGDILAASNPKPKY